ncbi:MAG: hypothetical protein LUD18_12075 [Lachnospiraceae bacterium]|nr:hypothetical protein [Lachnospiraceae bacterium]
MEYTWIEEYLLGKPGVIKAAREKTNWIYYQVEGRTFSAVYVDANGEPYFLLLKLEPAEGYFLQSTQKEVSDDCLKRQIDFAYEIWKPIP